MKEKRGKTSRTDDDSAEEGDDENEEEGALIQSYGLMVPFCILIDKGNRPISTGGGYAGVSRETDQQEAEENLGDKD